MNNKGAVISIVAILLVIGAILAGCEKPQRVKETIAKPSGQAGEAVQPEQPVKPGPVVEARNPKITVTKSVVDLGDIGPATSNLCEFEFKNTGDATLKIRQVTSTCSCTIGKLEKTEYAAGESGKISVTYHSNVVEGTVKKNLEVLSNDPVNPRVELIIQAKVVLQVVVTPRDIELLLDRENAGLGDITIQSRNGKEFAITSFISSGSAVEASFDPAVSAKEFVLKPKVDIEKLRNIEFGRITIGITHPDCKQADIAFTTRPMYGVNPSRIIVQNASPAQPINREVLLVNNYGKPVKIKDIKCEKGYMEVVGRTVEPTAVRLQVKITPPLQGTSTGRYITDRLTVTLEDGTELQVNCSGWYAVKR